MIPGVDSPFFSIIVLFKTCRLPWVSGGFLERRIPGKNGEGTPRVLCRVIALHYHPLLKEKRKSLRLSAS